MQCNKCACFGHTASRCRANITTCTYCAESHSFEDCHNKNNVLAHKCTNCFNSSDSQINRLSGSHNPFSHGCPIRNKIKQQTINNINWGISKSELTL